MPYCPHCGNPVDQLPGVPVTEDREPVEVTLARIESDRAIAVARIEANARRAEAASAEEIAETEADAKVDAAEAVAEIVTAAGEDEGEDEPDPVEIIAPETVIDDEDHEDEPPPAEGSPVPSPKHESRGLGFW